MSGHHQRRASSIDLEATDFGYISTAAETGVDSGNTRTWTNVAIGGAHPNRLVIFTIHCQGLTNSTTYTDISINGVTADQWEARSDVQRGVAAIACAKIPTGTTANVVFTSSDGWTPAPSGTGGTGDLINGYRAVNYANTFSVKSDANDGGGSYPASTTLTTTDTIPADGFKVSILGWASYDPFTYTLTGAETEDYVRDIDEALDSNTRGVWVSCSTYSAVANTNHVITGIGDNVGLANYNIMVSGVFTPE